MRNPFEKLCNETVYYVKGTEKSGLIKATLSKNKVTIFDTSIDFEENGKIFQVLPNGREIEYTIKEVHYTAKFASIPPSYELALIKTNSLASGQTPRSSTTINISNSHGFQVGDHNIQQITNSLTELINQIDASNVSMAEKAEAKNKLKDFLCNPTVASIIGSATAVLLSQLTK